ncbi:hypothetical protein Q4566_04210 [Tamlana sp. 2_MG-2023]|uniref:hypothetical protein n=1 Tax=unclassified Tamlana TaxID=2614803 RepID=UPI0026E1A552|nr:MULTISPECIES: hypothetical protein [unclassified Tamlana]MDO6759394.1 hypothetical protein [Tamlana sp. 2_MG-2023]MDO6790467.1 hypothetical protein [Tamlana sp. 1_MG-2023]
MKNLQKPQSRKSKLNGLKSNMSFLLLCLCLSLFTNNAAHAYEDNSEAINNYNRGYGKSFIFVENNIEFSIFPDGQFDFNILRNNNTVNVSINAGNTSISFNSGYNYNSYVQYDEYGAIIQVENTPIFYDAYGRVIQAGNINIFYNNFGNISRVGNLNVYYNANNYFSYTVGYINIYNRGYIYRPWHRYYRAPRPNYCVVYNKPYRTHYRPVRYRYVRPFINNSRPRTAIATRRGHTINKNRGYATAYRSSRNITTTNRVEKNRKSTLNKNYKSRNNTVAQRSHKPKTINSRDSKTKINKNKNTVKNPNNTNARISNRTVNNTRNSQLAKSSQRKVKTPSVTKSRENKTQRTAQNRTSSSNNNTRSTTSRVRS